ncbi:MAG: DUF2948 family protein [Rhodobacteraceae bacterium]|jgi:hypothetical protein|nr:DUF2948 family protein [Paracoccaceae bacterium]NCV29915.1 DUF2948 family protein [Paracoccaceae bacterium]NCV67526.1 DUF2948 family protein [Paracoccaceae bacterium]NCW03850.1 DUF2948 family protein [Paracoccaceae bacterium]NCW60897.1 DUF2948 family protein [Paracoccaceae bacterium]
MNQDAGFNDALDRPLNLGAQDAEDLQVISSLTQDAVLTVDDLKWSRAERQLVFLLKRFRWEDVELAKQQGRDPERVQSLLVIQNATGLASQGIDRKQADIILSLMSLEFSGAVDGVGDLILTFSGDGALKVQVDGLDVALRDVTRPYVAPSKQVPNHDA